MKTSTNDDFYSVFTALFQRLDREEEMEEGVGTVHRKATEFGTANSSREDVMKFYQEWVGFSTMKQFAYVDQYNPNDAPNRRIKRLIEQDNKRERYKERGRFNDKLRDLLAYIKSKDPRMEIFAVEDARKREQKRLEEEQRALEK